MRGRYSCFFYKFLISTRLSIEVIEYERFWNNNSLIRRKNCEHFCFNCDLNAFEQHPRFRAFCQQCFSRKRSPPPKCEGACTPMNPRSAISSIQILLLSILKHFGQEIFYYKLDLGSRAIAKSHHVPLKVQNHCYSHAFPSITCASRHIDYAIIYHVYS